MFEGLYLFDGRCELMQAVNISAINSTVPLLQL